MTIDWSKAPEGATHAEQGAWGHELWYKIEPGVAFYWRQQSPSNSSGEWAPGADIGGMNDWAVRPALPWSGEGLPPVGTVCALAGQDKPMTIIAHVREPGSGVKFQWLAVGQQPDHGMIHMATADHWSPYRTPEQIAAEEREKELRLIEDVLSSVVSRDCRRAAAEVMHDAGYRKVEGGAA